MTGLPPFPQLGWGRQARDVLINPEIATLPGINNVRDALEALVGGGLASYDNVFVVQKGGDDGDPTRAGYVTVQAAATAAAAASGNNCLFVCPGTYDENVTVGDDVHVFGLPGAIIAPATGHGLSITMGAAAPANGVTVVRGLTVQANDAGSYALRVLDGARRPNVVFSQGFIQYNGTANGVLLNGERLDLVDVSSAGSDGTGLIAVRVESTTALATSTLSMRGLTQFAFGSVGVDLQDRAVVNCHDTFFTPTVADALWISATGDDVDATFVAPTLFGDASPLPVRVLVHTGSGGRVQITDALCPEMTTATMLVNAADGVTTLTDCAFENSNGQGCIVVGDAEVVVRDSSILADDVVYGVADNASLLCRDSVTESANARAVVLNGAGASAEFLGGEVFTETALAAIDADQGELTLGNDVQVDSDSGNALEVAAGVTVERGLVTFHGPIVFADPTDDSSRSDASARDMTLGNVDGLTKRSSGIALPGDSEGYDTGSEYTVIGGTPDPQKFTNVGTDAAVDWCPSTSLIDHVALTVAVSGQLTNADQAVSVDPGAGPAVVITCPDNAPHGKIIEVKALAIGAGVSVAPHAAPAGGQVEMGGVGVAYVILLANTNVRLMYNSTTNNWELR